MELITTLPTTTVKSLSIDYVEERFVKCEVYDIITLSIGIHLWYWMLLMFYSLYLLGEECVFILPLYKPVPQRLEVIFSEVKFRQFAVFQVSFVFF